MTGREPGTTALSPATRHLALLATPWQAGALLDGCLAGGGDSTAIDAHGTAWSWLRVAEPEDALAAAASSSFDVLALCTSPGSPGLATFAGAVRRLSGRAGVVGIAKDPFDLPELESAVRLGQLDDAFLDDGSGRVLPALLRLQADRLAGRDATGRRVLLLVEDEAAFASFLLPAVLDIVGGAAAGGGPLLIALARTFEEAVAVLGGADGSIAAVISDLGYPRGGSLDPRAGLDLLRHARHRHPTVRLLAQSFEAVNQSEAEAYGFEFVHKRAEGYLDRLAKFLSASRIAGPGRGERVEHDMAPALALAEGLRSVGSGPLGGRARGLHCLGEIVGPARELAPGLRVAVAPTLVIRPSVGEALLASAELQSATDWAFPPEHGTLARRVLSGRLPETARAALEDFLLAVPGPVVVSASTSLDDLPGRPVDRALPVFAVGDRGQQHTQRLACLEEAVKRVFAAAWLSSVADALEGTPYRPEQLRLGVLATALTGTERGSLFFPLVSARIWSYNAYPFPGMQPQDGVAELLLGVGGDTWSREALRFCPAQPRLLPQLSDVEDILHNAQRRFTAVDLPGLRQAQVPTPWSQALAEVDVSSLVAELGAADLLSSYLNDADRVVDGLRPGGVPLLTFSGLLKGRSMPFPDALNALLPLVRSVASTPVEMLLAIEPRPEGRDQQIVVHDLRPMGGLASPGEAPVEGRVVVRSGHALGLAGRWGFGDIVMVLPGLDRGRTIEAAGILEQLNRELKAAGRRYLLIGPGRWGSRDPWLGIPVAWSQISAVGAIVETDFSSFEGDPSFGSHFFHTLTSQSIPYLSVHRSLGGGEVDWEWLQSCPAERSLGSGLVRLLRCDPPLQVRMEGASRLGLVIAPGER